MALKLGDQAVCMRSADGKGGTLITRKAVVFSVTGSVSRDTLVTIATRALLRL